MKKNKPKSRQYKNKHQLSESGIKTIRGRTPKLPIILSLAAIIVSVLGVLYTSYLEFFWKSHNIAVSLGETGYNIYPLQEREIIIYPEITFINNGNQYAVISNVTLLLRNENSMEPKIFSNWDECSTCGEVLPIILKPGEIIFKKLTFEFDKWALFKQLNIKENEESYLVGSLEFEALDSEGRDLKAEVESSIFRVDHNSIMACAAIGLTMTLPLSGDEENFYGLYGYNPFRIDTNSKTMDSVVIDSTFLLPSRITIKAK